MIARINRTRRRISSRGCLDIGGPAAGFDAAVQSGYATSERYREASAEHLIAASNR